MAIKNMACTRCGEKIVAEYKLLNDAHSLRYDICKCQVKKMYQFLEKILTHPRSFKNVREEAKKLKAEIDDNLKQRGIKIEDEEGSIRK